MLFKSKKIKEELERQKEAEALKEQERKRREEELALERRRHEEELLRIEEERKNANPLHKYRFSEPKPRPKELVSVLSRMLQKTFPDAKKAFLLLSQYNDKSGYLLVVDIDPRFLKIINLYLDGETKPVRNSLPIECILYAKSGSLTDGIQPFYVKEVSESDKSSGKSSPDSPQGKTSESVASSDSIVFGEMPEFGIKGNLPHDDRFPGNNSDAEKAAAEKAAAEKAAAEKAAAEKAAAEKAAAEKAAAEKAAAEKAAAEKAAAEKAAAEKAAAEKAAAEKAAAEKAAAEKAAAEKAAAEKAAAEKAAAEKAAAEKAAAEKAAAEKAAAEKAAAEKAAAEKAAAEKAAAEKAAAEKAAAEKAAAEKAAAEKAAAEKAAAEKVLSPTVETLFTALNTYGLAPDESNLKAAEKTFGDFEFYIPYNPGSGNAHISNEMPSAKELPLTTLVNIKTKSRAIPFFTSEKAAAEFAGKHKSDLMHISYRFFKEAHQKGIIKLESFDGIIINPNFENIFLPCDYPII